MHKEGFTIRKVDEGHETVIIREPALTDNHGCLHVPQHRVCQAIIALLLGVLSLSLHRHIPGGVAWQDIWEFVGNVCKGLDCL
jgi:hypothetical protein